MNQNKKPTRSEAALQRINDNKGPGTKEHSLMPKTPNYLNRRIGVAAFGLSGAVAGVGLLVSGNSNAEHRPPATTVVEAVSGDTIWDLQRKEANISGVHPDSDIRDEIDKAVALNGGPHIEPGDSVILVDIADK